MIQRQIVILAVLLLMSGTAFSQTVIDRPELEALMDKTVETAMSEEHLAGGVFCVVTDGEIFSVKGYGYANLETRQPADPNTSIFRMGSLAKPFVGTAVLQLAEQGLLDLDTDVNTYLAAFKIPDTFAEPVTLRHLLTHTGGFEVRVIGSERNLPGESIRPLAEALQDLMPERVYPPGKIASYSNWGVSLAGHIVARVSGMSFPAYVRQNIFTPLNMNRSTFEEPLPDDLTPHMAVGYTYDQGGFQPQPFEFISDFGPAGALSATAVDMANFMIAHLQKGQLAGKYIFNKASAAEMHRRQFGSHPDLAGVAINFGITSRKGKTILAHNAGTMVFHAYMVLVPEDGVGVMAAFNGPGSAADKTAMAFLDRYYPKDPNPLASGPDRTVPDIGGYAGIYRSNRLPFYRLEKAMYFSELTVHDTGPGRLFIGDLLSDTTNPEEGVELVKIGPGLFHNPADNYRVAFSKGPAGTMDNLFLGGAMPSFHRIPWYESIHVALCAMIACFFFSVYAVIRYTFIFVKRRKNPVKNTPRIPAAAYTLLGMSLTWVVFIPGFVMMILSNIDKLRYPPGIGVMLALPVANLIFTAVAAVRVLVSWHRGEGTVWGRLGRTSIVAASAFLLWVLNLWHVLGWNL